MFISVLDLFKIGIGPSSSHTLGPMTAAFDFINQIKKQKIIEATNKKLLVRCTLKGSLAFTGKGHSTDRAVALGLHGYLPINLVDKDVAAVVEQIWASDTIQLSENAKVLFSANEHIIFDKADALPQHPNAMIFDLFDNEKKILFSETYFSIGGGFICALAEIEQLQAPLKMEPSTSCKYPFDSATTMLQMADKNKLSISQMKLLNELEHLSEKELFSGMDKIWQSMQHSIKKGLTTE
ncbi:MAG: L-serine ammonia-lyase, partial [Gammaproteobacteria bacterium]|nr:L-serine ammonia-lyase [Gammaproteobacteria bacterium]